MINSLNLSINWIGLSMCSGTQQYRWFEISNGCMPKSTFIKFCIFMYRDSRVHDHCSFWIVGGFVYDQLLFLFLLNSLDDLRTGARSWSRPLDRKVRKGKSNLNLPKQWWMHYMPYGEEKGLSVSSRGFRLRFWKLFWALPYCWWSRRRSRRLHGSWWLPSGGICLSPRVD